MACACAACGIMVDTIAKPPAISAPIIANNFLMLLKNFTKVLYKRIMVVCDCVLLCRTLNIFLKSFSYSEKIKYIGILYSFFVAAKNMRHVIMKNRVVIYLSKL